MADLNGVLFNWFFSWSHRSIWLDFAIAFFAQYVIYLLFIAALFILFSEKTWRRRVFIFGEMALATILSLGIIAEGVKFFYKHPRPFDVLNIIPLISASGNSFPSAHATFLFALATVVFYLNKRWGLWFYVLSFMSVAARVAAGVDWPLDVIGGALIGILSALAIHSIIYKQRKEVFERGNRS